MRAISLLSSVVLVSAVVSSCKLGQTDSGLNSGGGSNPAELGCQGLQENFVDDGLKFEERLASFNKQVTSTAPNKTDTATNSGTGSSTNTSNAFPTAGSGMQTGSVDPLNPGHTPNGSHISSNDSAEGDSVLALADNGEVLADYKGVSKKTPFRGKLADAFGPITLPDNLAGESDCTKYNEATNGAGIYDTCIELVKYFKRVKAIINVWDNDTNGKRCYEGKSFDNVISPEFGYCDNECGFNDEYCYDCKVSTLDGLKNQRFVCKSLKTATDAIGGFCRNSPVGCSAYDPNDEKTCKRVKGSELSGGTTDVAGGKSEEMSTVSLSGFVGATEKGKVNIVVSGEAKASVRGTATGTIGIKRSQGVGSMFTKSGLGAPGLQVQCIVSVSGIASISYEFSAGVGADFVIAGGSATVDVGGSASFTEAYVKTSPSFSGAGQTLDGLIQQCATNYLPLWLGNDFVEFSQKYSGLRVIKKSIQVLATGIGLDQTKYTFPSTGVYCTYPNYDANKGYRTGQVTIYNEDTYRIVWTHYRHFGFDSLAPDSSSQKLDVTDVEQMRPYLRNLKDGTLSGQTLIDFYNNVVVPASKNASDKNWHMSGCFGS